MDQLGGGYQALKAAKKMKDVEGNVRKKAKSIGSKSDVSNEMDDDVQSVKSSSKKGRSKSGESKVALLKKKRSDSKGKKSDPGDGDIEKGKGSGKNYKQIIYAFVARDSDMFVFENHYEPLVQTAKFKAEIFEVLNQYQDELGDESLRPPTLVKQLLFDNLQLHLQYDVIYYGIVTIDKFTEDKAQRLLTDVKEEVRKLYKGNVQYMKRQTNLEHNCMQKFIKPKMDTITENYISSINSNNLNAAFQKVAAVKNLAGDIIDEQLKNMEEAEKLQKATQDIKWEAQDYEKGSKKLENMMASQEFWMCSKKCILMFLAIGIVLGIIIAIISAATGGDDE